MNDKRADAERISGLHERIHCIAGIHCFGVKARRPAEVPLTMGAGDDCQRAVVLAGLGPKRGILEFGVNRDRDVAIATPANEGDDGSQP